MLPKIKGVLDGLLAGLGGQGLIGDAGTSYLSAPGPLLWHITKLGRSYLSLFDEDRIA